jgi:hypothetical protein
MEEDALKASMHAAPQVDAPPELIQPSHLCRHRLDNRARGNRFAAHLAVLVPLRKLAQRDGRDGADRLLRSGYTHYDGLTSQSS